MNVTQDIEMNGNYQRSPWLCHPMTRPLRCGVFEVYAPFNDGIKFAFWNGEFFTEPASTPKGAFDNMRGRMYGMFGWRGLASKP